MSIRVSAESLEGLRRLQEELPKGGLRPIEIPRAVLDTLVDYAFELYAIQMGAHEDIRRLMEIEKYFAELLADQKKTEADSIRSCMFCDGVATLVGSHEEACDDHRAKLKGDVRDLSYADSIRRILCLIG